MGKLFIVATPIGNLEDITFRAIRTLSEVDLILCEDTRKTQILLKSYKINKPLYSYHQHSKIERFNFVLEQIQIGKSIALVSEAGTPGISDPGQKLISYLLERLASLEIIPIPGSSAVTAALSISGFPTDKFLFLGFLPKKKGRQKILHEINNFAHYTIVIYESPHRILKTLRELSDIFKDREIVVCRELTKKFEQIYRGNILNIIEKVKPKGEFVVIIEGKK
ncbi:MAG: 16S rRNA (cytidine(1402)-2'-O)-methyltransferase [Candidatus Berkelbacteria bacterium]|nr:16S rRNA (cytidine(1402)-2'-O)-methyltransferase [Candidatus Berkelbacteria bacterium]